MQRKRKISVFKNLQKSQYAKQPDKSRFYEGFQLFDFVLSSRWSFQWDDNETATIVFVIVVIIDIITTQLCRKFGCTYCWWCYLRPKQRRCECCYRRSKWCLIITATLLCHRCEWPNRNEMCSNVVRERNSSPCNIPFRHLL